MAQMPYDPTKFLVLDEPTNHLNIATKQMLIAALSEYEGTMLFVSHDRRFLAALSNRVLELTPEGIHQYGGGYSEYVARTWQEAPGLRSRSVNTPPSSSRGIAANTAVVARLDRASQYAATSKLITAVC